MWMAVVQLMLVLTAGEVGEWWARRRLPSQEGEGPALMMWKRSVEH